MVYLINVDRLSHELRVEALAGMPFKLHPVRTSKGAADQRVTRDARFDKASEVFRVPARSATVFVLNEDRAQQVGMLGTFALPRKPEVVTYLQPFAERHLPIRSTPGMGS